MSSARLPEHAGSATPAGPAGAHTATEFDSRPAALPEPPLAAYPPHLVPCAHCAALNGRSALGCWSCEADLRARWPRPAVAPHGADIGVPVVHEPAVAERDDVADGRRGLHLVSRMGARSSVLPVPEPVEPAFEIELPVLTSEVQGPPPQAPASESASASASASASVEPSFQRRFRFSAPVIALAFAAVLPVILAASQRWLAPAPGALQPLATPTERVEAAFDRPFATPSPGDMPDGTPLSFLALEVAPDTPTADRAERAPARGKASAPARSAGRAREGRSVIEPVLHQGAVVPAPCTSNMAALGFCTLEPASAKE